jgi:hypothetical protein
MWASRERRAIETTCTQCPAAARLTGNHRHYGRWNLARILRLAMTSKKSRDFPNSQIGVKKQYERTRR